MVEKNDYINVFNPQMKPSFNRKRSNKQLEQQEKERKEMSSSILKKSLLIYNA